MQTYDAIVLAGGRGTGIDVSQPIKGLIEIASKPMVAWVVEALEKSEFIDRIVVVLPAQGMVGPWADNVTVIRSEGTLIENCEAGLAGTDQQNPLLWLSADIPAITPQAIEDFLLRAARRQAQIAYPVIPEEDVNRQFPGSARTYIKLNEGRVTGGNMLMTTVTAAEKIRPIMSDLFEVRKEPVKVARLIGPALASKLALGRLGIPEVEKRIDKMFGLRAVGVITSYAAIGVDVDKGPDKRVMEQALAELGSSAASHVHLC